MATAILFFFAGFDTTSTTLSIVVHALVHHPEVQEKVRKEIEEVIGDEEITAENLKDLKYTENVIHESLRKYFKFGGIRYIYQIKLTLSSLTFLPRTEQDLHETIQDT